MWDTAETVGVLPVTPIPMPQRPALSSFVDVFRRGRDRLHQVVDSLEAARVPYALIGGKAIAAWINSVEPGLEMGARSIDVLIHRRDLERALEALEVFGYPHRKYHTQTLLRDSDLVWHQTAIRLAYAGAQVRPQDLLRLPNPDESCSVGGYRCLALQPLVEMLLAQFRTIDRVQARELVNVDLVNADWLDLVARQLRPRLQDVLEDHRRW